MDDPKEIDKHFADSHPVLARLILVFSIIVAFTLLTLVWNPFLPSYEDDNPTKSPSLSEVEDLIEKVESLNYDIKTASCEFDKSNLELYESALIKFNLLKKQVYEEYKKINWKKNKSEKILESYQQIIDGYAKEMKKEYKKMLKQFDAQMENYVEDRLDKIDIIKNM